MQSLKRPWLLLAVWCGVITAVLYSPALSLPFFFDDLDHFPYIATHTLPDLWQSTGGFPYYRPFPSTIWWATYHLLGQHKPLLHHALNLLLHAANGWLVGWIATRLAPPTNPQKAIGWVAASLYLAFPFSYQAVAWVGAVYHLWATFLVLAALFAHVQYQQRQQIGWLLLALGAVGLAPFAHENGLIAPVVLIGYSLLQRAWQWWMVGYVAPWGVWAWLWSLVTQNDTAASTSLNHAEAIWQNSAYFAQGFAYPFTWVGGWLRDNWGWNDLGMAVGLTLLAILLLTIATAPRLPKLVGAGVLFYGLAALPALLLLDFAYVISAPRLLLMPSVGAALVWAGAGGWVWAQRGRWGQAAVLLLLLITLAQNGEFIRRHLSQHTLLGEVWWQATQLTTAAQQTQQTPVFINFPTHLTAPTTTYPLGHEGTVFMVPYIFPLRIVQVNGAMQGEPIFRAYEDTRPAMPYFYDVLGMGEDWPAILATHQAAVVYNTHYTAESITLVPVGEIGPTQPHETGLMRTADGQLTLLDAQFSQLDEQTWQLKLVWQATAPLPWEMTIFAHATAENGTLITQADGQAWANTLPLAQWPIGSPLTDIRTFQLPASTAHPQVRIGLYNWQTGARLPLQAADGTAVAEQGWLVSSQQ